MNRAGRVFFILFGLLLLVFAPRFAVGFYDRAEAARAAQMGEDALAAQQYARAAQRLFWEPALWEKSGLAAWRVHDSETARRALETAMQRGALSSEGREVLGRLYFDAGDWRKALDLWMPLFQRGEGDAALYERLAWIYERFLPEEEESLLAAYRLWVQKDPSNAYAQYRLGVALALREPEEALSHWMTAARLDEAYDPVVQTLRTGVNLALLQEDSSSRNLLLGRALALAEEWGQAKKAFELATLAEEENGEAWAWLGEAEQHLGEDGGDALTRAVRLSPRSPTVRSLAGLYWQRRGEYALAEMNFRKAADLEPQNPAWAAALAEVYALEGNLPEALETYQRAISLSPDSPLYWRLLAAFCANYRVYLQETGLPAAQKALTLSNQDALSWDTLGEIYFSLNQPKEAEDAFLHALESNPNLSSAYLHLGRLYLNLGDRAAAKENLLRAYETARDAGIAEEAKRLLSLYFPQKDGNE